MKRYIRPLLFLFELVAYRLSDQVFFISNRELVEAIRIFGLKKEKCFFVPHIAPTSMSLDFPRTTITSGNPFTIIFFGDFAYPPNKIGLHALMENIVPLLLKELDFPCRLIIFGKDVVLNIATDISTPIFDIQVLGFVRNPEEMIKAADIVINPISSGAGVQTKIIDAIALGTTVICAASGAGGLDVSACGQKLITVPDASWDEYINQVIVIRSQGKHLLPTPDSFFEVYSELNVIDAAMAAISPPPH